MNPLNSILGLLLEDSMNPVKWNADIVRFIKTRAEETGNRYIWLIWHAINKFKASNRTAIAQPSEILSIVTFLRDMLSLNTKAPEKEIESPYSELMAIGSFNSAYRESAEYFPKEKSLFDALLTTLGKILMPLYSGTEDIDETAAHWRRFFMSLYYENVFLGYEDFLLFASTAETLPEFTRVMHFVTLAFEVLPMVDSE